MHITLIYNARLLDSNMDTPGALLLIDRKIRSVFQGYFTTSQTVEDFAKAVLKEDGFSDSEKIELYDARGLTVTPAFIDMHVHFRYPGLTEKEDLNTGLHAAAAGGYGTVVAMPNTKPVVSDVSMAMQIEREAAAIGLTHLFQTVSITKDFEGTDTTHLDLLDKKYIPVISEDGHDVLSSAVMLEGMTRAGEKGSIVACHCEAPTLAELARPFRQSALKLMKENGLSAWGADQEEVENTPDDVINQIDLDFTKANEVLALAEDIATERNIALAREAGCHIHLCHVSTARSMDSIRRAKEELLNERLDNMADQADAAYATFVGEDDWKAGEGESSTENYGWHDGGQDYDRTYPGSGHAGDSEPAVGFGTAPSATFAGFDVTCEVTPHHLALCGTEEPFIRALVNPPLRSEDDRLALIEALRDGTADVISTDHAPHTFDDKATGAPGFTGLETSFAVCNTVLVKDCSFNPRRLSMLMSGRPAQILGLQKGLLKPGYDADITLLDPDEEWTVDGNNFYSKGKATPFEGMTLHGRVKGLFIDGRLVLEK